MCVSFLFQNTGGTPTQVSDIFSETNSSLRNTIAIVIFILTRIRKGRKMQWEQSTGTVDRCFKGCVRNSQPVEVPKSVSYECTPTSRRHSDFNPIDEKGRVSKGAREFLSSGDTRRLNFRFSRIATTTTANSLLSSRIGLSQIFPLDLRDPNRLSDPRPPSLSLFIASCLRSVAVHLNRLLKLTIH